MNVVLTVCYDGTDFSGWQIQKNGRTVQGCIEEAIERSFGFFARVTGSGRTDSGVHAAGQVCNFQMPDEMQIRPERIADALNARLPSDVRVLHSAAATDNFDACRSAKRKTYRYAVYFSAREIPLYERYCVRFSPTPEFSLMRECAEILTGEHDFSAFSATGSSVKTTVRAVFSLSITPWQGVTGVNGAFIDVCGNGFLYNMVRIIAGAILDCGTGKLSLEAVKKALRCGDRELLGKTMPAKGLTLSCVDYREDTVCER